MILTNFGYDFFIVWLEPTFIDWSVGDSDNQGLGIVIAHFIGEKAENVTTIVSAIIGILLFIQALLSNDFRGNVDNVIAEVVLAM